MMRTTAAQKCLCLLFSLLLVFLVFTSVHAQASLHGDVDNSGAVTAADARMILRAAVELERLSPRQMYLADCNADGEVTAADARLALRAAVGLETLNAHLLRADESGRLVCVICGFTPEETTTAQAPLSEETTTGSEAETAPPTQSAADPAESTESSTENTTEETTTQLEPTPADIVTIGDRSVSVGEPISQVAQAFVSLRLMERTVCDLDTYGCALEDGGVLLVFADREETVQAFYVLSGNFVFDGIHAGDSGEQMQGNADLSLYYDLRPFGANLASVPNRQFFCDPFQAHQVYALFCRAPGVSFVPDVSAPAFCSEYASGTVMLTNAFRAFYNVPAVKTDAALAAVAQTHSMEMAAKDYYSHDSHDGTPFYRRLEDAGISYVISGENIAAGSMFPWETLQRWVTSEGQRKNLLQPSYTSVGTGVAFNPSSRYQLYWTQDYLG